MCGRDGSAFGVVLARVNAALAGGWGTLLGSFGAAGTSEFMTCAAVACVGVANGSVVCADGSRADCGELECSGGAACTSAVMPSAGVSRAGVANGSIARADGSRKVCSLSVRDAGVFTVNMGALHCGVSRGCAFGVAARVTAVETGGNDGSGASCGRDADESGAIVVRAIAARVNGTRK